MKHATALVLLALALGACNGPTGLLPGGRLDGETAPAPEDWGFAGDHGTAQLETRPGDPYSVNLVYTVVGGAVYVNAGDTETEWVRNMTANPQVRLRVDGALYDLRAVRVTDDAELDAFAEAWTSQSMFRRDPRQLDGEAYVYRLIAR
ncbi:MAG: nitroreductase/quinone reductase family protein [Myxococcota bacterium]